MSGGSFLKHLLFSGFFLCVCILQTQTVWAQEAEEETIIEPEIIEEESSSTKSNLLDDMNLAKVQETITELLGEDTFDLQEAVEKLLNGEEVLTKEYAKSLIQGILFSSLNLQKETIVQILLLIILAALFANFSNVFQNSQIGEMSYYMVYLLLLAILIRSFGDLSSQIHTVLTYLVTFMKALMPAYFLAITVSSGTGTAMMYYEMVLALTYIIQVVLLTVILPGVNIYVLLELVNYLHKEDFLSKMAELLKMIIEWALKTCLAFIVGLQVVQSMVTPVLDSLKRTIVGKTASAIPGVGNAIDAVAEVVLGTSIVVRNCLGVAAIIVLVLIGIAPLIKLAVMTILYKFLAALTQPVSDKRIVGCLNTVGEGCALLLKMLVTIEVLCMITIAILAISFFGT